MKSLVQDQYPERMVVYASTAGSCGSRVATISRPVRP